ncbi:prolyl oligopeptidase family serine peptidase [Actinoplanes sp. KI2]|uniref:S9 family peptidase n=1 Tax=Actinoplanes sp. KI2 TaxID=2983315 RepID=UPI0021D61184|nr:prolyl oligopeptidase family serine peptidase [Actinoplanes sp. KI2]MCU7723925.1 prolyl oligopeptidase family serine peptidase [Actinoplanes sp. KI2]
MRGQLVAPVSWTSVLPAEAGGSWGPSLAPDGGHCAYLSDRGGRPQVWVQPVAGPRAVLVDTGESPVVSVQWSGGGDWLACQVAPGGAPRHEVWLVRPDGSGLRQVAGFGADTAENVRWLPGRPLLALTENLTTAVLVDPEADSRTVVATGVLVALLDVSPDGKRALLRVGPRGARRVVERELATAVDTLICLGEQAVFGPDGTTVYARAENGEFPALIRSEPIGSAPPAVLAAAEAEVEGFALTPDGTKVAVLWNVRGGESEVDIIGGDGRLELPGSVVTGLGWSFDGSVLAFAAEGPGQPPGVWVHAASFGTRAVSATPAAAGAVRPTLETFAAHDELTLTGWLYRPRGAGPHPAVIWLHGGPEAQQRPGHEPLLEALVARGIAVFAPNVRGSAGLGRAFVTADNGPLRYGAIEDVRSSVRHLLDSDVAERTLVGCIGRSYGGYLTLAALTRFPDLFAVGVDVCGMSSFETFYRHTEPWIAAAAVPKYGDPVRDAELLADLSPMNHLGRLRAPLMVVHGENDTNVPVIEAEQLVAALAERGHPHRYLLFPGEGHELQHSANRAAYLRETIDWLTTHLWRR